MHIYKIDPNVDIPCMQQKYIYPAEDKWNMINNIITKFLKRKKVIYYGGWSIHHFLKSIDPSLKIYDEENICDVSDHDIFGMYPAEDLMELADTLTRTTGDLTYMVASGMHPNQFTLQINFLSAGKMCDYAYMSPKIWHFIPKVKYSDSTTCLEPKVELLKQYVMFCDSFLVSGAKDLNKALKRTALLEEHALQPFLKSKDIYWNGRSKLLAITPAKDRNIDNINIKKDILNEWYEHNPYVASVGVLAFNEVHKTTKNPSTFHHLEFVIHDAIFYKSILHLLDVLRRYGEEQENITLTLYDAFISDIGPLYNGWLEVKHKGQVICKVYSMLSPVNIYKKQTSSYFFNMAHMMWRTLYALYTKNNDEYDMFWQLIGRSYKRYMSHPNSNYYTLQPTIEHFLGILPVRNMYMVKNIQRKQGQMFRYTSNQEASIPREAYLQFYKKREGDILFKRSLAQTTKLPQLNFLYDRQMVKKEKS